MSKENIFERNPILTVVGFLILLFLVLELLSYFLIYTINPNYGKPNQFNRELSGYYVSKNTPNFKHGTFKDDENQQDIVTDEYGFIYPTPINKSKDPNTIRIFLMGGSGLMGAGQTQRYSHIYPYPKSIYAYNISIAGFLKRSLERYYPKKHIEVINASSYTKTMHQSFLHYLETVSSFNPDLIISMDGFNDVGSISTGQPYKRTELKWLQRYVDLSNSHHPPSISYFYNLLHMLIVQPDNIPLSCHSAELYEPSFYSLDLYLRQKGMLVDNSKRFTQILRQYMSVLQVDNVEFIFSLQPMLTRQVNKELSHIEENFNSSVYPFNPSGLPLFNLPDEFPSTLDDQAKSLKTGIVTLKFFFDDHLSQVLKSEVESAGYIYVDFNQEIQSLSSSQEFYTDYVHLTQYGNQFAAEKLAEIIIKNQLLAEE